MRDVPPTSLFNFMSLPTRPVIFQAPWQPWHFNEFSESLIALLRFLFILFEVPRWANSVYPSVGAFQCQPRMREMRRFGRADCWTDVETKKWANVMNRGNAKGSSVLVLKRVCFSNKLFRCFQHHTCLKPLQLSGA